MKWVPSHVSEEEFLRKGCGNSWRQQVNDLADKLCGEKAAELAHPDVRAASQYQDHCSKKAQEFLASRAEKILTAMGKISTQCIRSSCRKSRLVRATRPPPGPAKSALAHIGRDHITTQQEWFQALVRTKPVHAWERKGLNLRCAQCQLKLLHTKNRKTLALAAHQCTQLKRRRAELRADNRNLAKQEKNLKKRRARLLQAEDVNVIYKSCFLQSPAGSLSTHSALGAANVLAAAASAGPAPAAAAVPPAMPAGGVACLRVPFFQQQCKSNCAPEGGHAVGAAVPPAAIGGKKAWMLPMSSRALCFR